MCVLQTYELYTCIELLNISFRLLDVIAGRKDPKGLQSGRVLVDNNLVTSDLRLCSAYVVQVGENTLV